VLHIPTSRPHRSNRLAALLLTGTALVTLAACSDDPEGESAPKDAAVADFCDVIGDLDTSDPSELVDQMVEVGTPEGIPGEARDGFEVMVDQADAESISDDDQEKVNAFIGYVAETCSA
jgi:hypothetical protein